MAFESLNDNSSQDLSASLLILANYSNFYSIVTVLVCFIITVIFILRLNGDHLTFSSSVVVKHVISEQKMIGIQNPFSVQMDPSCTSSLLNGLHCLVSSLASSSLCCYWGVEIDALYKEFQLPWTSLQKYIDSDEFLVGSYVYKEEPLQLSRCNEKKLFLPTPQAMKDLVMTPRSRVRYPVVLLNLSLNNSFSEGSLEVVALLSVIHLKDTTCCMNSCILNQHLKTNNNQILNLQPLFVASSPSEENTDDTTTSSLSKPSESSNEPTRPSSGLTNEKPSEDQVLTQNHHSSVSDSETPSSNPERNECIVCQCEQISTVLLPCRHACVCSACLAKLERCPMCREFIASYFWLEQQTDSFSSRDFPLAIGPGQNAFVNSFTEQERWSFKRWIVQLNNAVNNYLGFR